MSNQDDYFICEAHSNVEGYYWKISSSDNQELIKINSPSEDECFDSPEWLELNVVKAQLKGQNLYIEVREAFEKERWYWEVFTYTDRDVLAVLGRSETYYASFDSKDIAFDSAVSWCKENNVRGY